MDNNQIRLVNSNKLFNSMNISAPFPFGHRNTLADDKLFGERKQGFHFEHIASEFENSYEEADSGIESEVSSSTLSPGSIVNPSLFSPLSVSSLASPVSSSYKCDDMDQTKPLCLVKKERLSTEDDKSARSPVCKSQSAKHWKKSLKSNFLNTSDILKSSPKKVLRDISNIMPSQKLTEVSKPKIVQPWNIESKSRAQPAEAIVSQLPAVLLQTPSVAATEHQRVKSENMNMLPSYPQIQIKSEPGQDSMRIPVISLPETHFSPLPSLYPIVSTQEQQHHNNFVYFSSPLMTSSPAMPSGQQHTRISYPTLPSSAHSPTHLNTSTDYYHNSSIFSSPSALSPQSASLRLPTATVSDQPLYYCKECKKSFCTESGFMKHQHLHSSNQIQKQFSCKYCQKTYNSQSALKMHIRTHTLPCKCPECGKSFSRPWLLQGHMRTHTGEKPFSCTHCSRNFADKSNLRAHLQTHLQNKKYSCPACMKSFSRMSLLTKHTESGCNGGHRSGPTITQPLMDITNLISS